MLRLTLTLATVLLTLPSPAHADVTGKPRIIDGDTLEIAGERIRLHGIDAPEARQTCTDQSGKEGNCGQEATWALVKTNDPSPTMVPEPELSQSTDSM